MADRATRTSTALPMVLDPIGTPRRGSVRRCRAREDVLGQLRALRESELGAATTYGDASRSLGDAGVARRLSSIAGRHAAHADALQRQIERLSGRAEAPSRSGAMPWAKLSDVTEAFLTGRSRWKTRREREPTGLRRFGDALDRLDAESREVLLGSLIPGRFRLIRARDEAVKDG